MNSECEPNCEFDFARDCGIVQLRVRKRIGPGDEIFVKYGPEFFEINACLCRTCRLQKLEQNAAEVFESLLEGCIYETPDEVVFELGEHIVTNSLPSMPKNGS